MYDIWYRAIVINLIFNVIKSVALATACTTIYFDFIRIRLNDGSQHSVSQICILPYDFPPVVGMQFARHLRIDLHQSSVKLLVAAVA